MRDFIRFLFSGNDVNKIVTPTTRVDDVLLVPAPLAGSPAPGSMRLRFRQNAEGPVQIRPLLPGSILFIADPAAAGVLPDAAAVDFTSAAYAGWKTLGRLLITVDDKALSMALSNIAPGLPVKPNKIWYGPVRIPQDFLFNTLLVNLKKARIRASDGRMIKTNNPEWAKHVVAEFLAGRYTPTLRLGVNATLDDVIRFVMPTVEVPVGGDIELFVTTALAQKPQDGPDADFDNPANPISRNDPLHPCNGLIPAREVYRQLQASMVNEADSEPLRDAVLANWPNAPRFFPIQFTRTWDRIPNCSVHFTRHKARVQEGANTLMEQQLPAHGVSFLRQSPANPEPAPPNVQVSLVDGDMKWLLGGGTSWRDQGQTVPVGINLEAVAQPHIAVRLPMTKAMFSDTTRPRPGGGRCTYLSLRRVVRALVDNRIAGGRLNFGVAKTRNKTRGIIQRAFAGTDASVNDVAKNAPDPNGDPNLALVLARVLSAFSPNAAPQQPIPGAPVSPQIYDQGKMAYELWQTITDSFKADNTTRNFSEAHIGRGGPGAAVALGLAIFHVDPARNPGEADGAYFDRVAALMLGGLQPGAPLQFWHWNSDYETIKDRLAGSTGLSSYGHSPIFVDYMRDGAGNITGIRIIDQYGEKDQPRNGLLTWNGDNQEIWIAANWKE